MRRYEGLVESKVRFKRPRARVHPLQGTRTAAPWKRLTRNPLARIAPAGPAVFKTRQLRHALAIGAWLRRAEVPWCCVMQEFVHRKNLENYRMLLAGELDKTQREVLLRLLAEEEAKELPPLHARDDN